MRPFRVVRDRGRCVPYTLSVLTVFAHAHEMKYWPQVHTNGATHSSPAAKQTTMTCRTVQKEEQVTAPYRNQRRLKCHTRGAHGCSHGIRVMGMACQWGVPWRKEMHWTARAHVQYGREAGGGGRAEGVGPVFRGGGGGT